MISPALMVSADTLETMITSPTSRVGLMLPLIMVVGCTGNSPTANHIMATATTVVAIQPAGESSLSRLACLCLDREVRREFATTSPKMGTTTPISPLNVQGRLGRMGVNHQNACSIPR